MKLLLVEDDFALSRSIKKLLKVQSYSVDAAYDGQEALDYLAVADYDLIILDVMMPVMDGLTFLELFRKKDAVTPVLMLTAKDTLTDKVTGLDAGADDYLVKPFELEELLARIRAVLRRHDHKVASTRISVSDLDINLTNQTVSRQGEMVSLTTKEFQLLAYLVQHKGAIVSKEQIREHVWDFDYEGESNIIEVLIRNLRKKLDKGRQHSLIKNKRGAGYSIVDDETI